MAGTAALSVPRSELLLPAKVGTVSSSASRVGLLQAKGGRGPSAPSASGLRGGPSPTHEDGEAGAGREGRSRGVRILAWSRVMRARAIRKGQGKGDEGGTRRIGLGRGEKRDEGEALPLSAGPLSVRPAGMDGRPSAPFVRTSWRLGSQKGTQRAKVRAPTRERGRADKRDVECHAVRCVTNSE